MNNKILNNKLGLDISGTNQFHSSVTNMQGDYHQHIENVFSSYIRNNMKLNKYTMP